MATQEEKIAAAAQALQGFGTTDPNEIERFVALFWSQAALLPQPEPQEPPAAAQFMAGMTMTLPEDLKPRIRELIREEVAVDE